MIMPYAEDVSGRKEPKPGRRKNNPAVLLFFLFFFVAALILGALFAPVLKAVLPGLTVICIALLILGIIFSISKCRRN